jgi:hypothetical protein
VAAGVKVAGITITLGRVVRIVQVGAYGWHSEARIVDLRYRGQRIGVAGKLRVSVEGLIGRSRTARGSAVVEAPDGLDRRA